MKWHIIASASIAVSIAIGGCHSEPQTVSEIELTQTALAESVSIIEIHQTETSIAATLKAMAASDQPTSTETPTLPPPTETPWSPPVGLEIGDTAPDFTLASLDGTEYTLSDLRGRAVLVNFWATNCGYCRAEAPTLQQLYERYGGAEFEILGVSVDEVRLLSEIEDYAREFELTYPVLYDPAEEISDQYEVWGTPRTYFIDSAGVIWGKQIGLMSPDDLDQNVRDLIHGVPPPPTPEMDSVLTIFNESTIPICELSVYSDDGEGSSINRLDENNGVLEPGDTISIDLVAGYYTVEILTCDGLPLYETTGVSVDGERSLYIARPDAEIQISNDGEETICTIFISLSRSEIWGTDFLVGGRELSTGDSISFDVIPDEYDIMIRSCEGDILYENWGVDVSDDLLIAVD